MTFGESLIIAWFLSSKDKEPESGTAYNRDDISIKYENSTPLKRKIGTFMSLAALLTAIGCWSTGHPFFAFIAAAFVPALFLMPFMAVKKEDPEDTFKFPT
jgi:hypothetical protein